jgi:hypothetical protein
MATTILEDPAGYGRVVRDTDGGVLRVFHLDPLPGDFDEELGDLDPADMQMVEPSRERHLSVQFTLEGDDAVAL